MRRIIFMVLVAVFAASACWADETITDTQYTRTKGNGSWGTLCLPRQITAVTGATLWVPYYCEEVNSKPLYLRQIESFPIPAGTPVMFNYTGTTLTATLTGDAVTNPVETNYMIGNLSATPSSIDGDNEHYVLTWTWNNSSDKSQGGKDEIRGISQNKTVTIPQYRAYFDFQSLPNVPTNPAKETIIAWELNGGIIEEATGIEDVITQRPSPNTYNLAGQRVDGNASGILIINGKKVIK